MAWERKASVEQLDRELDAGAPVFTGTLLHRRHMEREERKRREREERERAEYIAELDAELDAAEAAEPPRPLTDRELIERITRERTAGPIGPGDIQRIPAGAGIRRQDREQRRREREATALREREAAEGLPRKQAKWDAQRGQIDGRRAEAVKKARDRCTTEEQAARDRAESELTALGARPSLEAVAA